MKLGALKGDLENSQQNLLTIRAPYDAVIFLWLSAMSAALCKADRSFASSDATDAKPLARLMLNESGLAKLKSDQSVRFFFEAYPYQRYGALSGKLDWVSPSLSLVAPGNISLGWHHG